MDGEDGDESTWLLATTRAVLRAATGQRPPAAVAAAVTDALGEAGAFAWVGIPGERPGTVQIRTASGAADLPRSFDGLDGESPTARAFDGRRQQFDTLDENPEYQQLRAAYDIPAASTGVSIPLGEMADGFGVLHWYADRDLTTDEVADTVEEMGALVTDALRAGDGRRELERERDRLEALRSLVSHDFGNPVNLGAGRLDLARTECNSEHLDHVESAFEQIDALVDEGLRFVKASRPVESVEELSLETVAAECWEMLDRPGGSVSVEALTVRAESQRLRMICNELFENAIAHSDGEVTVRIEALPDGGFAVVDDGPGIPEKHREYVFDRGYTTTDDRDGNGLALVRTGARAHGWSVRLGDGPGTRVEVHTDCW